MKLRQEVWEKAKLITSAFEGGHAIGNFDGQYLSMGVLQWNLGQGTLQPILKEVFSVYGANKWGLQELYRAINDNDKVFYTKINGGGKSLVEPWKTRLNSLNYSDEFQRISDKYCFGYKNKAVTICESFGITTDRAFCLAFDIVVQCGSLERYEMAETEYFDRLTSIAEVVAIRSGIWADDVRKRKMAIVRGSDQGRGWVGVLFDDKSMYEESEDDEIMDGNQIKDALGIKDAEWKQTQIALAKTNGIITSDHSTTEIVDMGTLCTMFNNLYKLISDKIDEVKNKQ